MKSDETMIPHPEAFVQNFFQITEIIFLLGRNKITLAKNERIMPDLQNRG